MRKAGGWPTSTGRDLLNLLSVHHRGGWKKKCVVSRSFRVFAAVENIRGLMRKSGANAV
jgi:hypothetical protein